jgi:hypothetical protein
MSMPVTDKCSHCMRFCGQGTLAQKIQGKKQAIDSTYRTTRKEKGGECGMP